MSEIRVNNITNRTGISGPEIAGIPVVDSTSYFVPPSGRTGQRYADEGENIVRDGLVLYLDAKYSYPGATGTNPDVYTWYDMSGNGNDGELVGGVGYNSANGGSLGFDAIDDYIDTSFSIPSMSSEFSFEIVANISSGQVSGIGNQWGVLWNTNPRGIATLGPGIAIFKQGNPNGPWDLYINSTYPFPANLIANTWNNITYVRDNSNSVKIYVNGVSIAGTYVDTTNHATVIRFMKSNGTEPSYIYSTLGKLAIAKIYNRALSAAEVLQNYNATKSRFQ